MKLTPKLAVLFVLLTTIPLAIVGHLAYTNGRRTVENETINRLLSTTILKQDVFKRWVEGNEQHLRELAQRPLVREYAAVLASQDPADQKYRAAHRSLYDEHLNPHLDQLKGFLDLSLLRGGDGLILVSTDERQEGKYKESQPYFVEGKSREMAATLRLKEDKIISTKARLEHLLISSPGIIYSAKTTGDYAATFISENVRTLLGFEPREFLEDPAFWADHIHLEDRPHVFAELPGLFEHESHRHEYRFRKKDGTYRWMYDELILVRDSVGNPMETVGYMMDIHEKRLAEEALRQAHAELEIRVQERTAELRDTRDQLVRREKLAVLGQLAGGVAHELRNPLAVMNNAIYYLSSIITDADATTREYLEIISSEIGNAKAIVSDLLDFSRTRSLEREQVTAAELVARVLEKQPPPEQVKVTIGIPPELPPVFVDPRQIGQVPDNLVANACHAMAEGGQVTITAELIETEAIRDPKS
ncbi:MAG: PAS domain-containing protein, partial [Chloroflexi bacterium]|nr:PAS domain-containing protein [Chloroflexota bacterium]